MDGGYAFDDTLRERINGNLRRFERQRLEAGSLRHAAIAVAIVGDRRGEACFVLTLRGTGLSSHAGQYALPGGRVDEGEDPPTAARRELHEEVGLDLSPEAVVGWLDDYETRSAHLITPIVVWVEDASRLTPNPAEVDEVYLVPLADLDRPGNPHLSLASGSSGPLIHLSVLDTVVFAPAAAILYQFRDVALHGRATRVAHLAQPRWAWR
jgi:8-oxo-dGTP pyrophosphatase MutT (NUDIX family)